MLLIEVHLSHFVIDVFTFWKLVLAIGVDLSAKEHPHQLGFQQVFFLAT